jgi:hypothetical protein
MSATLLRSFTTSLPWLVSVFLAIWFTYVLAGTAASAPSSPKPSVFSDTCTAAADPMLVYAVSTHRVPATVSADCRVQPSGLSS